MSAEPSERQASDVDLAIDRVTRSLKDLHQREMDALRDLHAEELKNERASIAKMLEAMCSEWRSQPGGCSCGSCGGLRLRLNEPVLEQGTGRVIHPGTLASPIEVWVLERAAARVRARK